MIAKISLEAKHRIADPDPVLATLFQIGAKEGSSEVQRDFYYNVRTGTLKLREGGVESCVIYCNREERDGVWENRSQIHVLRPPEILDAIESLRDVWKTASFIAMDLTEVTAAEVEDERLSNSAARASKVARGVQASEYLLRAGRHDVSTLHGLLTSALGVRCSVEKRRRRFEVGDLRVALDAVKDLGDFIELEGHIAGKKGPGDVRTSMAKLERGLGLTAKGREPRGYADMVRPVY